MENKQDKGFTLVELLIVIVILGILATVTVFAVRGITDQGQKSACDTDKRTMETAIEAFYAQKGTTVNPSEAMLVSSEFLRAPSKNWNMLSPAATVPPAAPTRSSLVAQSAACGAAGGVDLAET
mgnify:CR=1 FL=1